MYNISINAITEQTSFFTNYEYNVNLFLESKKVTVLAEQVKVTVNKMHKLHRELQTDIEFLLHCSVFYYNQHHAEALTLKKRDKVYLLQRNIKMTRSSNKLDHVKIESFKIIRNIKETSFELKLSERMWQKHLIFHVSLLESALKQVLVLTKISDNYLIKQEREYEIKQVLQHKDINCQQHYLVKWKEYSESENTWESVTNLNDYKKAIEKYL